MSSQSNRSIRVAVVTGGHPFDVPAFHALFRSFADVDCYIQHVEDFTSDVAKVRQWYDVVIFYNMTKVAPADQLQWYEGRTFKALEQLGDARQGILFLHHGLLAFPQWPQWDQVIGVQNRRNESYHFDQVVDVHVADRDHPITQGLADWSMKDETYVMSAADPAAGNRILLSTDHPKSVKTLAWVRTYREAPVLCYQGGHDAAAWGNPGFQTFLHRGIQWLAGRM